MLNLKGLNTSEILHVCVASICQGGSLGEVPKTQMQDSADSAGAQRVLGSMGCPAATAQPGIHAGSSTEAAQVAGTEIFVKSAWSIGYRVSGRSDSAFDQGKCRSHLA